MVVGDQDDVNGGKIQQFSLQSKHTGICLFSLREGRLLCNVSDSCKSTAIATSRFVWCNSGGGGGVGRGTSGRQNSGCESTNTLPAHSFSSCKEENSGTFFI